MNDRADLALATGADGVHVGADDLPVAVVRRLLGPAAVVGGTARDPADRPAPRRRGRHLPRRRPHLRHPLQGGLPEPIGLDGVRAVAAAVDVPVIAIAGITPDHVADGARRRRLRRGGHRRGRRPPDPRIATRDLLMAVAKAAERWSGGGSRE